MYAAVHMTNFDTGLKQQCAIIGFLFIGKQKKRAAIESAFDVYPIMI